jgi:hypothetical protein
MLHRFQRKTDPENKQTPSEEPNVFGKKVGLINRLIGCSHRDLSRPFVDGNIAYRSCLTCGARRQFNVDTFESFGKFYYPPITRL